MDNELKSRLLRFMSLCDDMNDRLFADEQGRLRKEVNNDLISYLSYLIFSDRVVSGREVDCINYYFDKQFSEDDIRAFYVSDGEEISVPMSLVYFVRIDNDIFTENETVSTLSEELVNLYKGLGMEMICSDKTLAITEFKDYEEYISMMETYKSAYLKCMAE